MKLIFTDGTEVAISRYSREFNPTDNKKRLNITIIYTSDTLFDSIANIVKEPENTKVIKITNDNNDVVFDGYIVDNLSESHNELSDEITLRAYKSSDTTGVTTDSSESE